MKSDVLWEGKTRLSSDCVLKVSVYSNNKIGEANEDFSCSGIVELRRIDQKQRDSESKNSKITIPCNWNLFSALYLMNRGITEYFLETGRLSIQNNLEINQNIISEPKLKPGKLEKRVYSECFKHEVTSLLLNEFAGKSVIMRTISQHIADLGWNVSNPDLRGILQTLESSRAVRSEQRIAKAGHRYTVWEFP